MEVRRAPDLSHVETKEGRRRSSSFGVRLGNESERPNRRERRQEKAALRGKVEGESRARNGRAQRS